MHVQSLGQEDPLKEDMATHSSILAWRSPWTEESGGITKSDTAERLTDTHAYSINLLVQLLSHV